MLLRARSTVGALIATVACALAPAIAATMSGGTAQAANGDPGRLGLGNMASAGPNNSTTVRGLAVPTLEPVGAAVTRAGHQDGAVRRTAARLRVVRQNR